LKHCVLVVLALVLLGSTSVALAQGKLDYTAAMMGAKIHYKGSRWAKAAALFHTAVAEKPGSAEARYWLGLALAQMTGDAESIKVAAAQFDTCFALDTGYVSKAAADEENVYLTTRALSGTATVRMGENAFSEAVRLIHWAIKLNPNNPNYYLTLGTAYVQLDMADSIRIVAEDMLKRDSASAQAAFFLGIYFSKVDKMDSSFASFVRAGTRYEADVAKQKDRLVKLLSLKTPAEAEPIAKRLVVLRNETEELKKYIESDLKQAGPAIQPVAEVANGLFMDMYQIGLAFFRAGQAAIQKGDAVSDTIAQKQAFATADEMFAHAVAADPENYDALWYQGYANYRVGRDSATIRAFRAALVLSEQRKDLVADKDPEIWLYLGTSEARLNQYDSAVAHLHRAIAADPTNANAYNNLAYVFKDMSRDNMESPFTDSAVRVLDEKDKLSWRATAWRVEYGEAIGENKAPSGYEFAAVELTVFNKTDKAGAVEPAQAKLTGDDGKSYALDAAATAAEFQAPAQLDVAGRKELSLVFALPRNVKARSVVLELAAGGEVTASIRR
jgi:tetratricopeptide (TPR) repeat protein